MALDVNMVVEVQETDVSKPCSLSMFYSDRQCSPALFRTPRQLRASGVLISGVPFVSSRNAPVLTAIPHH
jgi:hypothetical protein